MEPPPKDSGQDIHLVTTDPEPSDKLRADISKRLVRFREQAGLDVKTVAERAGISVSGATKMESPEQSNPTILSIAAYLEVCDRSLGEFFELWTRETDPHYDRYVHHVMQDALRHPVAKQYVRSLIGLLSEVMK